jgi:hypothetical protein
MVSGVNMLRAKWNTGQCTHFSVNLVLSGQFEPRIKINLLGTVVEIGMEYELYKHFKNVTRETITLFLNICGSCQRKGNKMKGGLVVKPINSSEINSRCQIDLVDSC